MKELIYISSLGTPSQVLAELSTWIGIEGTQMESAELWDRTPIPDEDYKDE